MRRPSRFRPDDTPSLLGKALIFLAGVAIVIGGGAAALLYLGVPAPGPPDTSCARPLQDVRDAHALDAMRQFAEAEPEGPPDIRDWQPESLGRDVAVAIRAHPDCFADAAVKAARYADRNPDEPGVWSGVLDACPMLRYQLADDC